MFNQVSRRLDKVAILLASVCLVHCLMLPVVLTAIPLLGLGLLEHASFHRYMLWLVLPVSVIALGIGCARHRNGLVAITGILGLALVTAVALLDHGLFSDRIELALAVAGGVVITISHILNYNQCRTAHSCDHDPHPISDS